ncbi:DUF2231 domain-containing protein [Deinococcus sonorensis]|uniref:DUF2231 domain-containing protein n=2 Tax=Deinococcus sonorensis TaxID=309891 RepID=A0AAU7UFW3_9DEIO
MSKSETAADALEATLDQDWIETAADTIQPLLRQVEGRLPDRVLDLLHGVPIGHPLHPALVHLPLGGWMTAGMLDLMGVFGNAEADRAADTVLLLGTVGATATIVTGWTDWSNTRGAARRDGLVHGLTNETAFLLNIGSLLARRKHHRKLGRLLSGTALLLSIAGAFMGGQLVYRHGLGVGHTMDVRQG